MRGPGGRGGQVSSSELQSGAQRGDGAHVRGEVAEVHLLGLVEELDRLRQVPASCEQPGLGDAPAVGVLRQTCGVAELAAQLQVVRCGGQVVAFVGDAAEADVHVGGSPRHRERVVGGEAQRVLVGPQRVGEPALGDADVGQGDGAAQHVGDVPGRAQPFDTGRVGAVCLLQVAAGPAGEPGGGGGPGPGQVVVLGGAGDGEVGVGDGRRPCRRR